MVISFFSSLASFALGGAPRVGIQRPPVREGWGKGSIKKSRGVFADLIGAIALAAAVVAEPWYWT